jgi:hypothetical protein
MSISARFLVSLVVLLICSFVSGTTRHLTAAESADAMKAQVEQMKEQVQQQAAQLKDQGSEEVNTAMNDLAKKCGPNANTVVDDQCYASCSGSFNFDGSTCTCNGSPCESWKVGETGPTSTSSDSTNAPALATAVSSSGLTVSPMFFLATSLVLLVQIAL